ncbi:MAG: hypothetical protein NZ918_04435 [Aigarchaeota archaeon]|nr:hypothetical protein [Aigarchaeota archaeon]
MEAKRIAAKAFAAAILPSNSEVAVKLLEYALLTEGDKYWIRLEKLRREALSIMSLLEGFKPRLVGSVWRGIIKPKSDIDIEVDYVDPEPLRRKLIENGYEIIDEGPLEVPEHLRQGSLWKIRVRAKTGGDAEIILKEHHWYLNPPKCDIFGDVRKGLQLQELIKVLEESPSRLFIPEGLLRRLHSLINSHRDGLGVGRKRILTGLSSPDTSNQKV